MAIDKALSPIIAGFRFDGDCIAAQEITTGHINRTYRLTFENSFGARTDYILQSISTQAFHHPDQLMENVLLVTEHLRRAFEARGISAENRVLRVIPTLTGGALFDDAHGGAWRAYNFIVNAHSVDRVESPEQFRRVGSAFGEFQRMLADFPIERLHDTIPDFHNTVKRIANFERSVGIDAAGRRAGAEAEIAFARAHKGDMGRIVEMIDSGELPMRVTHNDTKCNNVMVDDATGEPVCVVDLDTVMAGSSLYDFGDAIRFGASTAAEDERDLSKVRLDMELFAAFSEGFISQTVSGLCMTELLNLPLGALVITYENGIRFLSDYLDGDIYFRVDRPEQNLDRARCQFKLFSDMLAHRSDMDDVIRQLIDRYRN